MWPRPPVVGRGASLPSPGVIAPLPNTSPGHAKDTFCFMPLHALTFRRSYTLHSTLTTTLGAEIGYRSLTTLSVGIGSR